MANYQSHCLVWVLLLYPFLLVGGHAPSTPSNSREKAIGPPMPMAAPLPDPKSDPACSDLYEATCNRYALDDGTSINPSQASKEELIKSLKKESREHSRLLYAEAIKSDAYFRDIAIDATGLGNTAPCNDSRKKTECDAHLLQALTELTEQYIYPPEKKPSSLDHENTPPVYEAGYDESGNLSASDLLLNNKVFENIEKKVSDRVKVGLQNPEAEKVIGKDILPKVQMLMMEFVAKNVKDEKTRKFIQSKIKNIQFTGSDCETNSVSKGTVAALLIPNAFYNPLTNTFSYCNGFLLGRQSIFSVVNSVAHEIAHSFDPCHIAIGPAQSKFKYTSAEQVEKCENEFPFPGVLPCLRNTHSVGALTSYNPQTIVACNHPDIPAGTPADSTDGNATCPSIPTDPFAEVVETKPQILNGSPFCENDQLGEAFPDWVAAEIVPNYIENFAPDLTQRQKQIGYTNMLKKSCDRSKATAQKSATFDPHPPLKIRLNKILLVQPKIRKQMGCLAQLPAESTYCPVNKF